jgi:hypothetical protein
LAHASIPNIAAERSVPPILVSPSAAKTIGLPVGGAGAVVAGVVAGVVASATVSADGVVAVDPAVEPVVAVDADGLDDELLASLPHAATIKLANATYPISAFITSPSVGNVARADLAATLSDRTLQSYSYTVLKARTN